MSASSRLALPGLAALGALLAARSWGQWADPLVDFGHELYAAWRLSEGAVLFRDQAHLHGPLSPYVNALLFRAFGVGAWTLFLANLAVAAATGLLLHALVTRAAGRAAAGAAAFAFVTIFAFGQYTNTANYNYVAPYAHETTHGLLLSLAALALLARRGGGGGEGWTAAAGACAGAVPMTKPETALALAAALGAAMLVLRPPRRTWAALLLPAAAVPLASLALLATAMPGSVAVRGLAGPWRLHGLEFFRRGMGLEDPLGNTVKMLLAGAAGALAAGPGLLAAWVPPRRRPVRRGAVAALLLLPPLLAWLLRDVPLWTRVGRPLPLVAAALLVLAWRRRSDGPHGWLGVSLAAFALALTAKMVLNARVEHYGFVLAMPAAALGAAALAGAVPDRLDAAGKDGGLARAGAWGLLLAAALGFGLLGERTRAGWIHPLGTGDDALRVSSRHAELVRAIERVRSEVPPGRTLLVLPEGAMVNYQLRLRTPTRHDSFMPAEVTAFGEEAMLAGLQASPPDAVLVVPRDTREFGLGLFGRDYGRQVWAWLWRGYTPTLVSSPERAVLLFRPGSVDRSGRRE